MDYSSMTDSELSREIAEKVMGWEDWQQSPSPGAHFGAEGDLYKHGCVPRYWRDRTTGHIYYKVQDWSPPTDIAQAFEVVERMRELGFKRFCMDQEVVTDAFFQNPKTKKTGREILHEIGTKAAARAICIAALKAVGGES